MLCIMMQELTLLLNFFLAYNKIIKLLQRNSWFDWSAPRLYNNAATGCLY